MTSGWSAHQARANVALAKLTAEERDLLEEHFFSVYRDRFAEYDR